MPGGGRHGRRDCEEMKAAATLAGIAGSKQSSEPGQRLAGLRQPSMLSLPDGPPIA
jgi:hypothetical protein